MGKTEFSRPPQTSSSSTASPANVLWLTENYFPQRGGMAESCDRIVYGLRRTGFHIDVGNISSRAGSLLDTEKLNGSDITVPLAPSLPHALNRLWNRVAERHRTNAYETVVAFGGAAPLTASPIYASWLGVPSIVCLRGNDYDTAVFTPAKRAMLTEALREAACICTVSREQRRRVAAQFPRVRVECIPNGISLERWNVLRSDKARASELRRSFGCGDKLVVGIFGQLKAKKGLDLFLRVLESLPQERRPHLLLAGETEPELLAAFSSVSITVLPFQERYGLIPAYLACDAVAVPSHYDGLPNVLLEAAALERPILATAAGGMQDVLSEFPELLFEPDNQVECRSVLMRFASASPSERENWGRKLKTVVSENFSDEIETARYAELLQSIVPARSLSGSSRISESSFTENTMLS